jgi:cellulose synthase/poly-beta-1,6-N-acetylglucosamine synthase-like glycosyltransferase
MALAVAVELVETVLALSWSEQRPPRSPSAVPRHTAAVVMTVCDDWTSRGLAALLPLANAGYSVYVLDDSTEPVPHGALPPEVTIVRRPRKCGAKGGNLNHWLRRFGRRFDYLIVFDADSTMCVATADALLSVAEHPANADVAIVQSKTETDPRIGSAFGRAMSAAARPRTSILARVHCRLDILLSFGHNQLLRVAPVVAVGGFDERLTNEDTVLSLRLAAGGWRCVLADAWSSEVEPDTVPAYNRRAIRWARQTTELLGREWRDVPLRLKLLLCRHLLATVFPVFGAFLLALSLWTSSEDPANVALFVLAAILLRPGFEPYGLVLWMSFALTLTLVAGRLAIARREGVSWRSLSALTLAGGAPYPSLVIPLTIGLAASLAGRSVGFIPTSSRRALARDSGCRPRLYRVAATSLLIGIFVAGAIQNPWRLIVGFNAAWLALFLCAPLSLLVLRFLMRPPPARCEARASDEAWRT